MSEYKEIDECISELNDCYDKLYKCFCEGKFCTECNLGVPYDGCVLCILQDSIEILKEKSDELQQTNRYVDIYAHKRIT